ncbi:Retrovirus-related Pol polyprotein from transposon 17.6 [Gossypium australe]|uniref:Retrovirus-related Pol polyprotein from transposon 17.6 n=1 Tax=Gossypium australe TaxID=47621 RepID=A0A5B6VBZ3_9ROSI|nr:Retrovirus-related Pol polyprotein from transposon 17.6 [Gossypium australe]
MGLKEQALSKANSLYDFKNHPINVRGFITLLVTLGDSEHMTTDRSSDGIQRHLWATDVIVHTEGAELVAGKLFYDDEGRTVKVSLALVPEEIESLVQCLRANSDAFAWSMTDIPRVDPQLVANGECESISPTSIMHTLRTTSFYHQSIA